MSKLETWWQGINISALLLAPIVNKSLYETKNNVCNILGTLSAEDSYLKAINEKQFQLAHEIATNQCLNEKLTSSERYVWALRADNLTLAHDIAFNEKSNPNLTPEEKKNWEEIFQGLLS